MTATSAADGDVGGMPHSTESGVRSRQNEAADSPTGATADVGPAASPASPPAPVPAGSDPAQTAPAGASPAPLPAPQGPYRKSDAEDLGSDDGPLESLGKAISSPVEGATDDEALPDAKPPEQPPPKPSV